MAVELTDEEKTKFDALLKERGYDDHASKVIERLNGESKSHREAKEAESKRAADIEAELKKYRDGEAARKAEEDKKKAEDEKRKKDEEDEKKSTKQLIADLEAKFERELTAREQKAAKAQQEYLDDLKARDSQVLMLAVEAEAKEHGILDVELVKLLDVSKVPIERGIPDRAAITELIEEHAKSKPHLYKDAEQDRDRDDRGRFIQRPNPGGKKLSGEVDAAAMNDADFEALSQRLRVGRV